MSEEDLRVERLKKLETLRSAGVDAYPAHSERSESITEFLARFGTHIASGDSVTLAGRVMSLRGQGGILFADIFDGSTSLTTDGSIYGEQSQTTSLTTGGSIYGEHPVLTCGEPGRISGVEGSRTTSLTTDGSAKVQIVLQKTEMNGKDFELFIKTVDIGDFIEVTGVAYKTARGERSLKCVSQPAEKRYTHIPKYVSISWRMLSKSLLPIPAQHYGIKDEETRLRQRYLDLLLNRDLRAMFERRAKFWQVIRNFYLERRFLEVETPALETSPGGADARPFVTHHNALDIDVYLRISAGELWQKKLLIAGFPKVFEIGRIFRNEGQSREHLQDYTQLESYEAYIGIEEGMRFVQELYRHVVKEVHGQYSFTIGEHAVDFADEWPILDFGKEIEKRFNVNLTKSKADDIIRLAMREGAADVPNKERAADYLWKKARKTMSGPAFLTGVPVELEPLAKRSAKNPNIVERVQVIIAGSEIGKGYSELNDPQDQRARFIEQQKLRDAGDEEAQRLDLDYVRAMEYGMPPAFGFGVSERLFAFLENKPIHEAQLFPLLRPKE